MAIKHKASLGLDPASAEIIVLRRLADGDYFVEESGELKFTVHRALHLFQSGYSRKDVDYCLRLHPESGAITASRVEGEFCGPVIARLGLTGRGYGARVYEKTSVACDYCEFCEDDPVRCDQGCDKSVRLDEEKGLVIIFDVSGETPLLNLVQDTLDNITGYLKTKMQTEDALNHDELGETRAGVSRRYPWL